MDVIIKLVIDPFVLAKKLYSKEVMPEDVYKKVKDTREECLEQFFWLVWLLY